MADLDSIQATITQVAIQDAAVVVMVLQEADTEVITGANVANVGEVDRPMHCRSAPHPPTFNCKA